MLIAALAGTQWGLPNLLTAELREKPQEATFEAIGATVAFLAGSADSDLPASDVLNSKSSGEDDLTAAPGDGKAIMLSSSPGEDRTPKCPPGGLPSRGTTVAG